jgi:hypothetical protein
MEAALFKNSKDYEFESAAFDSRIQRYSVEF